MEDRRRREDGGGLFALKLESGEPTWVAAPQCDGSAPCRPSQHAAVTGTPDLVFSAPADGYVRAYSKDDGRVIRRAGTDRDYVTVNRVKAHGGSINGPGPVVVDGMLYVNSGYPMPRGSGGNVLLAFYAP